MTVARNSGGVAVISRRNSREYTGMVRARGGRATNVWLDGGGD